MKLQAENEQTMTELARLQHENEKLRQQAEQCQFGEHFLQGDRQESRTLCFTGLPSYALFVWMVSYCVSVLPPSSSLSPANVLLLTLMKLRLNLQYQDLSFRFNISVGHVHALAKHINFLIQWPDKEEVVHNMPKVFHETYSKCHVIICTEDFIECPGNL